ncbi:MAG: class I SAM-dependent methyltransferase [Pseudomonadota bacterium]
MSDTSNPPAGRRWGGGALRALLAHLPAALLALLLWRFLPALVEPPYPAWTFWAAEGVLAALFAVLLRCAPWWWGINALFPPLLALALGLDFSPGWMGLLFLALLLVYWNAHGERVPLYLSNTTTHAALRAILEREAGEARRVVDLGSGLGGALRAMAEAPRVAEAVGVESAPLPWLVSTLRLARHPRIRIRHASIWSERLSDFDVVYAFLSPAPMRRLWGKLVREARRPMLLISNSFAVPDVEPDEVIELDDARRTELFLYRLPLK